MTLEPLRRPLRDARGAVFVEKLIVYLPLLMTFFGAWELAELGAAKIVVQRACAAAGRAAMVVLPDDPAFYDDEPVGSYDGQRRADIELAAGMILSAVPRLREDFEVDVSDAPGDTTGTIDVTVTAPYDCGLVSLVCGDDDSVELTAASTHQYHGAKYAYSSANIGSGGGALMRNGSRPGSPDPTQNMPGAYPDSRPGSPGPGSSGSGCTTCNDCGQKQNRIDELKCNIAENTQLKKGMDKADAQCLTDQNKAMGDELKKLKAELRQCQCKGPQQGPKYRCPYIGNKSKLDELIGECKKKFGNDNSPVEYYRVQGGDPPNASRYRVNVANGNLTVPEPGVLCVSTGDLDHAEYFKDKRNSGGPNDPAKIYKWNMPAWFDKCVKQHQTYQKNYSSGLPQDCARNLGGLAPKIVDPNQPGDSYEFNPPWDKAFAQYAIPGSGSICQ